MILASLIGVKTLSGNKLGTNSVPGGIRGKQ